MSSETVSQDSLKAAELALRDGVSRLGNTHSEVLRLLESYISLLKKAGNNDLAAKLELKAASIREILAKNGGGSEPAAPAQAQTQTQTSASQSAAVKPALPQSAGPEASSEAKKAELLQKMARAQTASEDGVHDLDFYDEDADEETMAMALELAQQTSSSESSKAKSSESSPEAGAQIEESGLFLYNSKGEHVAVAFKLGLYTPEGENIGRLLEDYDVFLDRRGWYLGQIVDGNRLARDSTWIHRHLNFGDRGNEGNCAGWGRSPDLERTYFDRGFEDVDFSED